RARTGRAYAEPLDVEALARDAHMSAGHFSREFKLAYGESPYSYLMTRRIERAMALLLRGDLSVTEVCFAVGCSSLGTFSTRFTELVGMPPSAYRRRSTGAMAGIPPCVAKQVTRPIRNRERQVAEPHPACAYDHHHPRTLPPTRGPGGRRAFLPRPPRLRVPNRRRVRGDALDPRRPYRPPRLVNRLVPA